MRRPAIASRAWPTITQKRAGGRIAAGLAQYAAALVVAWMQRARQRRHLEMLDDRLLQDLGLTRDQVRRECAKPFWLP